MKNKWEFISRHRLVKDRNYMRIPLFLHIELTQKCPVGCPQCYVDASALSFKWCDLSQRIVEASEWGVERILLTGGEPLVYPQLYEVLCLLNKLQMQYTISTSGVSLSSEKIRWLSETGVYRVYVSLNGSTQKIHNISRNRYDDAISALVQLNNSKISAGINWVARSDNYLDFPNIVKLGEKYNANEIVVLANKPDSNGHIQAEMSMSQITQLADMIKYIDLKEKFISIDPCFFQLQELMNAWGRTKTSIFLCSGGKIFCDILADNSIKCCRHLMSSDNAKNVNTRGISIETFWNLRTLDSIRHVDVPCSQNK